MEETFGGVLEGWRVWGGLDSGFEVREVFKKLLGGRGFVLTEYEPVGSHGDPVRVPGHWFWNM